MAATPLTAANAATAEQPPALPGDLIAGKYKIERMVAQGTTGLVFAAYYAKLGEKVALKFLRPELAYLPSLRARFECEARAAARLKSEHVVRVLDVEATKDGLPCIVMEYLEGRDLKKHLAAGGPLSIREAADCVAQACIGLAELHALGIVHRDLRPSNLFLTRRSDGSPLVKVLDFGISKTVSEVGERTDLTWMDRLQGCAKYISPEQARCAWSVDVRADVWSLGVILYELVTGELPFSGSSIGEILSAILSEGPKPLPKVEHERPAELQKVISKCLKKDAAQRMPSVVQLGLALAPWVRSDTRVALSRLASEPLPPLSHGRQASRADLRSGFRTGHARHGSRAPALVSSWAERTSEWPPINYDFLGRKRIAVYGGIAVLAACGLLAAAALCRSQGIASKAAAGLASPPRISVSAAPTDKPGLVEASGRAVQESKPAALDGPTVPATNDRPTAIAIPGAAPVEGPTAIATPGAIPDDKPRAIATPVAAAPDGKPAPNSSSNPPRAGRDTSPAAAVRAVNDGRDGAGSPSGPSALSAGPTSVSVAPPRWVATAPARSRSTPVSTRVAAPTAGSPPAEPASDNLRSLFEDRR